MGDPCAYQSFDEATQTWHCCKALKTVGALPCQMSEPCYIVPQQTMDGGDE